MALCLLQLAYILLWINVLHVTDELWAGMGVEGK